MVAIGYARVSTADQDVALQLDALAKAGCARVFQDKASGAKADRPGLTAALAFVRESDVLVVWKLDRLGRSLPHLIETVNALETRGVGFRSLTEAIDTTTPGGRLIFHIFGALGQFERDLIRERTRAGLDAAVVRGRRGGRRPVVTEEKLRRARSLIAQGLTVREAAARIRWARPHGRRCAVVKASEMFGADNPFPGHGDFAAIGELDDRGRTALSGFRYSFLARFISLGT
jgi:DNA invertase Pin-like site-specific DNA recombinase